MKKEILLLCLIFIINVDVYSQINKYDERALFRGDYNNAEKYISITFVLDSNIINFSKFTNLISVDIYCSNNGISLKGLSKCKKIEEIRIIRGKKIKNIPDNFKKLKKLKVFNATGCAFNEIPKVLTKMPNLEVLIFNACPIKYISKDISNLTKLKRIEIKSSYNNLGNILTILSKIQRLEIIDLSKTGIDKIPTDIKNLKELKSLKLCCCGLTSIPNVVLEMSNLECLDVSGNPNISEKVIKIAKSRLPNCIITHDYMSNY